MEKELFEKLETWSIDITNDFDGIYFYRASTRIDNIDYSINSDYNTFKTHTETVKDLLEKINKLELIFKGDLK